MSKLSDFRQLLRTKSLDAYIIPNNDEFQNEYLPPHARRLEFLTGFTGSAGLVVIAKTKAAFFTDGRYILQAQQQLNDSFEIYNISDTQPAAWLAKNNIKAGFDGWVMSLSQMRKYDAKNIQPISHSGNLVDVMWKDRPQPRVQPAKIHKLEFAGESSESKRRRIAATLEADAALLTDPASVNWLLNIRGADIPHTPLALCYAALSKDGTVDLFIDKKKVNFELLSHLGKQVAVHDITMATKIGPNQRILIDPARIPYALYLSIKNNGAEIVEGDDPCLLAKAVKNEVEIAGIRRAHELDGAAVSKFLEWLRANSSPLEGEPTPSISPPQAGEMKGGVGGGLPKPTAAPPTESRSALRLPLKGGVLDELTAAAKLEEFRRENVEYLGPSFDTISGFGSNGAIVHYHADDASNKKFEDDNLYLVDSGGQYEFGTTDVTRTVAIGTPAPEMKRNYTLVLKGHIALATAVFPRGTTGAQLDALARQFLWAAGLDYDHGTGHGVGYYLSVHEGPQGISKRANATALLPGMVLSNEPGYYKAGEYGIRLENLVLIVEKLIPPAHTGPDPGSLRGDPASRAGYASYLGFETLTKAPFDEQLIDWGMLTPKERQWLNNY